MTGKTVVMDHPLIAHKISYIRQENIGTKEFREVIGEIAQLMCYEATRDLKTEEVKIKTPLAETTGQVLAGKKLAIVPILRAGLGMVDGMLSLIPAVISAFTGIRRLWNRWNTTANFRRTVRSGKCLLWIPCWLQGDQVLRRSRC